MEGTDHVEQVQKGCGCCCGCGFGNSGVLAHMDRHLSIHGLLTRWGVAPSPSSENDSYYQLKERKLIMVITNKTFKGLSRDVRQLSPMLVASMPEALKGRGIICRKVSAKEVELLASLLKGCQWKLAKAMLRHLLCKCGWWQVLKAIHMNCELRMRAPLLMAACWE